MLRRSSSAPPHPSFCSRSREGMTLTPPGVACRLGPGQLVTLAVFLPSQPPSGARPERLTRVRLTFAKAIVGNGAEGPPCSTATRCSRLPRVGRTKLGREADPTRLRGRINKCTHGCAIVCAMVRNACKRAVVCNLRHKRLSRKEAGSGEPPDVQGFLRSERRRSRTYPAWGCQTCDDGWSLSRGCLWSAGSARLLLHNRGRPS
jgi:hypothetical protein